MTITSTGRSLRYAAANGIPGALVVGGDYQGLGIARSLGRRGIPVAVLDDEVSIAPSSRYVQHSLRVPTLRSSKATTDALHEAARRFGLDGWVLFPTREETVAAVARNRDELARTFRVPTPSWETVRIAWDKRQTYQVAERLGIDVPRCWFPRSESDLSDDLIRRAGGHQARDQGALLLRDRGEGVAGRRPRQSCCRSSARPRRSSRPRK